VNNESFKIKYNLGEIPCILQCGQSKPDYLIWANCEGKWTLSQLSGTSKQCLHAIQELCASYANETNRNMPQRITLDLNYVYLDQNDLPIKALDITKMLMKHHTTLLKPNTIYIDKSANNGGEMGLRCIIVKSNGVLENTFLYENQLSFSLPKLLEVAETRWLPIILNRLLEKPGFINPVPLEDLSKLPDELKETIVPTIAQ
jgi:hypothetical protein